MEFVEWFLRHRGLSNFNSYPIEDYHGLEIRASAIMMTPNGRFVLWFQRVAATL
jgi:hypothetical protein